MEYLFDDEWVDQRAGVRRVVGQVRKEPEPVLKPEAPWEQDSVQGCQALLRDRSDGTFRLWYRAKVGTRDDESEPRVFLCYAESRDGVKWERPSLGRFEYQGNQENNIVLELSEGDSVFWNILEDEDEPDPSRRYKAIGFHVTDASFLREPERKRQKGVCVAFSPDGFQWSDPTRVMSTVDLTDSDCVLAQPDPTTGKWTAFFRPRTHPKRRFIGYSQSDDFIRWTYPRMLLTPDGTDDEWVEFYGLTAACFGKWRVGCLWLYHNNPEYSPMTTELVYSRDGMNYRRAVPGTEFIPLGPEGRFDSRMVTSVALVQGDGETLVYYNGTNREHGSDRGMQMQPSRSVEGEEPVTGIGLARITGSNFCGLRADLDGMVETKWLCNYGGAGVRCAVETDPDGWVRAEILDQYGQVIPGWGRDVCQAREAPGGELTFSWGSDDLVGKYGQSSDEGGEVGHVVKVRFLLHKATLFGFLVGDEDAMPEYT